MIDLVVHCCAGDRSIMLLLLCTLWPADDVTTLLLYCCILFICCTFYVMLLCYFYLPLYFYIFTLHFTLSSTLKYITPARFVVILLIDRSLLHFCTLHCLPFTPHTHFTLYIFPLPITPCTLPFCWPTFTLLFTLYFVIYLIPFTYIPIYIGTPPRSMEVFLLLHLLPVHLHCYFDTLLLLSDRSIDLLLLLHCTPFAFVAFL